MSHSLHRSDPSIASEVSPWISGFEFASLAEADLWLVQSQKMSKVGHHRTESCLMSQIAKR